jgi:hypothetical protein
MAEPEAGAKVARDLGIYLGQLYGWVKKGTVKNYKPDGYPNGKGLMVDPDEARAAWMGSKKKGPRKAKGASEAPRTRRAKGAASGETGETTARTHKLAPGTIVSYAQGQPATDSYAHRPKYNIGQVVGTTGHVTFLDDGNHRVHYSGTVIDGIVFTTDRLSRMLARGIAHIERPTNVLGMVLLSFVATGKLELAQSLEDWMTGEGLEVVVPELLEPDDDDELLEEASQPVGADDDD